MRVFGGLIGILMATHPAAASAQSSGGSIASNSADSDVYPKDSLSLRIDISPTIGSDLTQDRGDRLEDAVAESKLSLAYEAELGQFVTFSSSAGIAWTSDFEQDDDGAASSALFLENQATWKRGCRTLNPYAKIRVEQGRDDFLGFKTEDSATFATGASFVIFDRKFCGSQLSDAERNKLSSFAFSLNPAIERVESSDPLNERWAPRIKAKVAKNIIDGMKLTGSFDYQYRIFDRVLEGSDRQHVFTGSAGIDFAKIAFGKDSLIDTLELGVSWKITDVEDTGLLQDKSKLSFTPSIGISTKLF